jgi:sulfur relay (sulfurtransferase) DsrC/TusE family protein
MIAAMRELGVDVDGLLRRQKEWQEEQARQVRRELAERLRQMEAGEVA